MEAYSKTYSKKPDAVFNALLEVIKETDLEVENVEKEIRKIEASTGMSWFSFGEKLEIIVTSKGSKTLVYVSSKAIVPWNVMTDVQDKVKHLFSLLDKRLSE